jgi:hypothetical protein
MRMRLHPATRRSDLSTGKIMRARLVLVLVSHHRLTQPAPAPRASVEWLVEFGFFGFGYPHRLPVEFVFDALSRPPRPRVYRNSRQYGGVCRQPGQSTSHCRRRTTAEAAEPPLGHPRQPVDGQPVALLIVHQRESGRLAGLPNIGLGLMLFDPRRGHGSYCLIDQRCAGRATYWLTVRHTVSITLWL